MRQQIRNLRQTGSVQNYTSQFRNLVGQTTGMGEQDQITYYIEGLKPATKMEVSYRAPATFEDAWKTAIQYDTECLVWDDQWEIIINHSNPTRNLGRTINIPSLPPWN